MMPFMSENTGCNGMARQLIDAQPQWASSFRKGQIKDGGDGKGLVVEYEMRETFSILQRKRCDQWIALKD